MDDDAALLTFVKNHLVSKHDDIKLAVGNETVKNVPTRLAPRLNIQSTDANDTPYCRFCYSGSAHICRVSRMRRKLTILLETGSVTAEAMRSRGRTATQPSRCPVTRPGRGLGA
jgi:hypothetical protein